ncbi:MAG: diguanylate cyclase [Solirubrobacteraceae bacterium]
MTPDPRQLSDLISAQEALAAAGLDLGAVLETLAGHVRGLTGAGGALVELVDDQGVVTKAAADSTAVQVGIRLGDATASARALIQRRLVRWDEHSAHKESPVEGRGGARSVMAAPLAVGEDVVGVVTALSSAPGAFDGDDEHLLRVLARFTGHQVLLAQKLEQAERTSRLDPLTALGNRRALDETLKRELARHIRYERTLSLVVVDLDGFKAVNDTHGHAAGDRVLATVGRRLGEIRGADAAFRLGGDEFAVVLPETRRGAAELVARRLARQIRDDTFPHEVSATWGIAEATGPDPGELLAAADRELYARKGDAGARSGEATG